MRCFPVTGTRTKSPEQFISRFSSDTFGRDLEEMIARKLTFGEIAWATGFTLMSKQRLRMIQRELFEQLELLNLLEATPSDAH